MGEVHQLSKIPKEVSWWKNNAFRDLESPLPESFRGKLSCNSKSATPLNSYKRLREGIVLSQNDQDPYAGVLFHETPLALKFFTFLFSLMSESCVNLVFIIGDILTAFVLGKVAELIATNLLSKVFEKSKFEYLK